NDARVQMTSQIILPRSLDAISLGQATRAGGVAYSGDRGVSRVELSNDGGQTWSEASLTSSASPFSWVIWTADLILTDPRQRTLTVRAYDGEGGKQDARDQDSPPAGATGLHSRLLYGIKEAPG